MRKIVAGKVKYIGNEAPKPCCPISDKIIKESLKEKEKSDDETTEKKDKHTK